MIFILSLCGYITLHSELSSNVIGLKAGGKCGEFERRRLLVSSVGLMIGALVCNGEIAEASQFADSKSSSFSFEAIKKSLHFFFPQ